MSTPPRPGDNALDRFVASLRGHRFRRRTSGRWVAGVCAGTADRAGLEPAVVRVLWVLAAALTDLGIGLYLVAWCLLPDDRGALHLEDALRRGRVRSILLLVATALALVGSVDGPTIDVGPQVQVGEHRWLLTLAVLGGVVWLLHRVAPSRDVHDKHPSAATTPGDIKAPGPSGAQVGGGDVTGTGGWLHGAASSTSDDTQVLVAPEPTDASSAPSGTSPRPLAEPSPASRGATRRVRRASLGWRGLGLAIGVAATSYATALLLHGALGWSAPRHALASACALAATSALVLVVGLLGRRGGAMTVVLVLLTAQTLVALVPRWGPDGWSARDPRATQWHPTSLTNGQVFAQETGGAVLDLSAVPAEELDGQRVEARLSAGALRLVVPRGVPVRVRSSVDAGGWQRYGDAVQESTRSASGSHDEARPPHRSGSSDAADHTQDPSRQADRVRGWEDRHPSAAMAGADLTVDTLMDDGARSSPTAPGSGPATRARRAARLTVDAHVGLGTITLEESP